MAEKGKTFLVDLSKCTACRGCQVACKQWHKHPAEKTLNWGSHQNPKDLSAVTWKLVRMNEIFNPNTNEMTNWLFLPEQCRHCVEPPCMLQGDQVEEGAIIQDKETGAVIFTEKTKKLDAKDIRDACPYDIPRVDPKTKLLTKCDMCNDRVQNGLLPACVQSCPTGTMNFGERDKMLELAEKRLAELKKIRPEAKLIDKAAVRVIYLVEAPAKQYFEKLMADAGDPTLFTRKAALAKVMKPFKRLFA